METTELIQKLRDCLKINGKTRQELAELIGVSKRTVDNWFAGRPMNPNHEFSLSLLLNPEPREKQATVVINFTDEQMARLKENFSSMEELELAVKSFILGNLYERAVKMVRAHGIDLPSGSDLTAADSEE